MALREMTEEQMLAAEAAAAREMEELETEDQGGAVDAAGKAAPRDDADEEQPDWQQLANESFEAADRYVQASLATEWARNLRMWQSRHPTGSKYLSPEYAQRSKIFRPKTRSATRKREAAAANAFFATTDVVVVEAHDDGDPLQRAAADVCKHLLNYRLQKTLPWFLTAMGAWQDTSIFGYCLSRQGWVYEEAADGPKVLRAKIDPVTGMQEVDAGGTPVFEYVQPMKVVTDRPDITLIPPENLRIDPAASWIDPVQASPYLIVLWPMFVCDIEARMKRVDPKTNEPKWKQFDRSAIQAARNQLNETTRRARSRDRQDPIDSADRPVSAYDIVWVREVFLRHDGQDWTFWTLGSQGLLSDPVLTEEAYPQLNRRPYRMGFSTLEAHQPQPTSTVAMGAELQQLANQIVNDRNDNVRLALQARYFVRAGQNVDLESLRKNVPGSTTIMKNTETDVRVERAPDVTRSAYEEQDRANVDYDELVGHFSAGTVQSQRTLNETVGGMNMLHSAVNSVQDFDIRVWAETWVEPVLRDLLKLEQALEDDPTVLSIAGKRAQLWQQYRMAELTDEVLDKEVHLTVNVGFGATDPMKRLSRFQAAAQTIGMALGPQVQQMLNAPEIIDEVFGILGYKDARRFFTFEQGEDPQVTQLKQQVQALQQELESNLAAERLKHDAKMQELIADTTATAAELRAEMQRANAELQQKASADTNKTLVAIMQILQNQSQHRDQMVAGAQDRALTARDQNISVDQERAKRLSEGATKVVEGKKKAEADKAEGDRFEKLFKFFSEHATANTKQISDLVAAVSKPRKFNLVRGADGKAAGVVQE